MGGGLSHLRWLQWPPCRLGPPAAVAAFCPAAGQQPPLLCGVELQVLLMLSGAGGCLAVPGLGCAVGACVPSPTVALGVCCFQLSSAACLGPLLSLVPALYPGTMPFGAVLLVLLHSCEQWGLGGKPQIPRDLRWAGAGCAAAVGAGKLLFHL